MYRKTRNDVTAHIRVVREMGTAVTAYNTIGNIKNCQDVSFQRMRREPMIGLLKTS
jgi:hypothetical protein